MDIDEGYEKHFHESGKREKKKFNRTNDLSNDSYYGYALLISLLLNNIFIYSVKILQHNRLVETF